jgi:nitrate/TMAO reductase-like tetraheme cytochrome c subunit
MIMTKTKKLSRWTAITAMALLAAGFAPSFKATTKDAMKRKLVHSQKVLEGVATEKYDEIEKNAAALIRLSQTEAWRAMQTDEYRVFSEEFRRNAMSLQRAAQKKNIDAASLAYVQMTINCVNCHKYVRGKAGTATL